MLKSKSEKTDMVAQRKENAYSAMTEAEKSRRKMRLVALHLPNRN
jgi:hypothetical protein